MKIMKHIILSIGLLGFILSSCGTTKESASVMVDTTASITKNSDAGLPYMDPDRTKGSVSPGAEENISNYQVTGISRPDSMIRQDLEPLKSSSTRSYNRVVTPYNNGGGEPNVSNRKNP
ncbi:MAG: hypothetical protein ACJ75J_16145 [Cytophagaceae bacterium]